MKNMLKLGLVLAAYATAACVGLAFVYAGTEKVIAERQKSDLQAALKDLFPTADSFEEIDGAFQSPDDSVSFRNEYLARSGGGAMGVVVRAVGASYGGSITVLIGVGSDEKIEGVKVLETSDTPGLGANAVNPAYYVDKASKTTFVGQFKGKSITDPFEVKGDVIAITASTITSKAVTGTVKAAGSAASQWLAANGGSK